ncbi:hypothetical protein [Kitasatospora sp. P5_F3]
MPATAVHDRTCTHLADTSACCTCPTRTAAEWQLTEANLWALCERIEPSKPHYRPADPGTKTSVVPDGLTIWPHGFRIWVRFGDTIRRDSTGRYTVQHSSTS